MSKWRVMADSWIEGFISLQSGILVLTLGKVVRDHRAKPGLS